MNTRRNYQFQDFYMTVAYEAAKLSRATKRHVGAIVVRDGNILGYGYNGTPHGIDNDCEKSGANGTLLTKEEVVHGEMNAILKAGACILHTALAFTVLNTLFRQELKLSTITRSKRSIKKMLWIF